jgi:mono/diheme cytochrome c family protein
MEGVGYSGLLRAACAAGVVLALAAAGCSTTDEDSEPDETAESPTAASTTPTTADPDQPLSAAEERGQALFVAGCGSCHTFEAAGTSGQIGPDLDELDPDEARVLRAIEVGGRGSGSMPRDIYSGREAEQVARFVSEN